MSDVLQTYDSVLVAQYLYAVAQTKGQLLNATQLQKMLYIAYGLLLAKNKRRLCVESPQAWPFGPVFPRTQKRFEKIKEATIEDEEFGAIKGDVEVNEVIGATIATFSGFSAKSLSDWSHEEGSPWDKTKKEPGFKWGMQINDELILNYFKRFVV